jgi:hypothetical protein
MQVEKPADSAKTTPVKSAKSTIIEDIDSDEESKPQVSLPKDPADSDVDEDF